MSETFWHYVLRTQQQYLGTTPRYDIRRSNIIYVSGVDHWYDEPAVWCCAPAHPLTGARIETSNGTRDSSTSDARPINPTSTKISHHKKLVNIAISQHCSSYVSLILVA
eukprot:scaffold5529_cov117-Cylindrotheca_fusiformis.AAC.37